MVYRISKPATQDIIDVYLQGEAMFGEAQADRYLADLYDAFDLLAANPRIARDRTEFRRPVRVHPFKAHVIVYRADGDDVLILRLRHGREDWLGSPAAND